MARTRKPKRYSAKQKAAALALYKDVGAAEAARRLKMAKSTLTTWARSAGLRSDEAQKTAAATEAAKATASLKRALLRDKLLVQALDVLERMNVPHEELKVVSDGKDAGSHVERVPLDHPTAGAVRDYAVALGVLIDKLRLEGGEATSRSEVSLEDARAKLTGRLDDLAIRRRARQAAGQADRR